MKITAKRLLALATLLLAAVAPLQATQARQAPWVGETLDGQACSAFEAQGFGPWDYTNSAHRSQHLDVVERAHFTPSVQSLTRGATEATPLHDLEYTIRAFPNHHPALYSLIRYATEGAYNEQASRAWNTPGRRGRMPTPPECYLTRAINFTPDDHRVHLLQGLFYHRKRIYDRAYASYERALAIAPDSAEGHYNFALLLAAMERPTEARDHAKRAYALGYPLAGLRSRLDLDLP